MSSGINNKSPQKGILNSDEKIDAGGDCDEIIYKDKMKVECICPKCGQRHKMNFFWIGRGTPRKYCPSCKGGF